MRAAATFEVLLSEHIAAASRYLSERLKVSGHERFHPGVKRSESLAGVLIMNTVHVKLRLLTQAFLRGGSSPSTSHHHHLHRLPRTLSQLLIRTMASTSREQECKQPPGPRKGRHKEPLRRVKNKESREKRRDQNGPATVYLQVVGAGSRDNPASLYVFSEFNR